MKRKEKEQRLFHFNEKFLLLTLRKLKAFPHYINFIYILCFKVQPRNPSGDSDPSRTTQRTD